MAKVSVIGAGNVGASAVYFIAKQNIADIVMVDVVPGLPQGKGLDFQHASPMQGYGVDVVGTNNYADIEGSDVVVHTAGIARKPGMDRMDLLRTNVSIARDAAANVRKYAPDAVVIVVSNPLDVIAMMMLRETGFPHQRVVGMAGILDSTRFRYFIAEKLGVLPADVQAMVLGGHGDSMVPLPRFTTVGGFPLSELMSDEEITALSDRTRTGGGEVINYLKTGSAYYAPAASAAAMVRAVLSDHKLVAPASAYLQGEYGYEGIFLGVPVMLGSEGVEKIYELPLSDDETAALARSAEAVRMGVADLDSILAEK
jgi:malate dehydrogenase